MDGYALIRQVRTAADVGGDKTPMLTVTASARPADRRRSPTARFNVHISTPINTGEWFAKIGRTASRPGVG